jgi:GTP:adenosylcobinamide-phosphate guanylyltransferase
MLQPTKQYDVIILAGYTPEPVPLSVETGQASKALIDIAGRPMISYVIEALRASGCMRRLILVGLTVEDLPGLEGGVPVTFVPNHGDIIDNSLAALDVLGDAEFALFCSTDIPLLTPEAVRDLLARCEASGADLCYPIVSRAVMEARFPGSGRTFQQLVDGVFCGGDMYLVRPKVLRANADFGRTLTARRKSTWRLAKALGVGIILRFLTHRLHIHDLEKRVTKILSCTCKAINVPYAELGMDVDKPHHLQVVLEAMSKGRA